MSYNGFFIRDYVGQPIDGPRDTKWISPDIICTGPTPLPDPKVIVNANNYNKGLPQGSQHIPLVNNWVYVRGVNPQSVPQTSTIFLYYAETSLILWPQLWKTSGIQAAGENKNWIQLNAPANSNNGGIAGTLVPFGWTPPRPHVGFCLLAWANNGPDQLTPPVIPDLLTTQDMAEFIIAHPNIGWKTTVEGQVASDGEPIVQQTIPIIGPASGGTLSIGLQCHNMPTDGFIEFSVPGPDKQNTIIFPKSRIVTPNYSPSFMVEYPPNFETEMTWTYYQGVTPPPAGASITPFVAIWEPGAAFMEHVKEVAPKYIAEVHHYGTPGAFLANKDLNLPPKTIIVIGSITYVF